MESAQNITSLDLSRNQIRDLGPLTGLSNLQTLDVSHNLLLLDENFPALAVIEKLQNGGTSVTFEPQNMDIFQGQPIDGFPGWMASPWYLNYSVDFWPWIYHDEHGWQFVFNGSTEDAIFLWDLGLREWIFLNQSTYRWMFLFGENAGWIFSFADNTPEIQFFGRSDDGSLFSVTDNVSPVNPDASLSFPGAEESSLLLDGPTDPPRPGGTFLIKDFLLLNLSPGMAVAMSADSFDFDGLLQILDRDTGEILISDDNSGPGQGALLTFTPQAGVAYVARVSNALKGQGGAFLLQIFSPQSITSINTPGQISGNLSVADAIDFQFPAQRFFKDDYFINGISPGQRVIVEMNSTDLDAFLVLINVGAGALLNTDDDGGNGFNSRIVFNVQDGVSYLVRASSSIEEITGSYTLSTQLDQSPIQRSIVGSLTTTDDFIEVSIPVNGFVYFDLFRFFIFGRSTLVTVTMDAITPGLDPFLLVINEQTEETVGSDDDSGVGLNSLFRFTAVPGISYIISPTTAFPNTSGNYRLTVSTGFLEEIAL